MLLSKKPTRLLQQYRNSSGCTGKAAARYNEVEFQRVSYSMEKYVCTSYVRCNYITLTSVSYVDISEVSWS